VERFRRANPLRDVDNLNPKPANFAARDGALGNTEMIVGELAITAGDRAQTRINRDGINNRERWTFSDADAQRSNTHMP
jgi:hypothetical protein